MPDPSLSRKPRPERPKTVTTGAGSAGRSEAAPSPAENGRHGRGFGGPLQGYDGAGDFAAGEGVEAGGGLIQRDGAGHHGFEVE
jgi:hypothetical protein